MSRTTYDLTPSIDVRKAGRALVGYPRIALELHHALKKRFPHGKGTLALECYPGTDIRELLHELVARLEPSLVILADDISLPAEQVQERIAGCITDDRVFGVMSHYRIEDFFDAASLLRVRERMHHASGLVITCGMGASLLAPDGLLVYADLTRWEITQRLRAGMCNWKTHNPEEDPLTKIKRGYFFEWRVADRVKQEIIDRLDYLLTTDTPLNPTMTDGPTLRRALSHAAHRPFRLVPYFDESVWGGQWMKERFGLDPSARNYGWSFDGVPEENSIILSLSEGDLEIPALDLVFAEPDALLGEKVRARFGVEFPIRFDFLDTMEGENLSLQVHPRTEYIQDRFGMHYTQDESYYIMDATESSCVYLGVRSDTTKQALVADLERSQDGASPFPVERHINKFPVQKHDHILIPAGTIHCSGAGTVVLEVSATPYLFTFKLWDWGRLGLDGRPRPINIQHGSANIIMERNETFCERELVIKADAERPDCSRQHGVFSERTGLHELEFIETQRHWFTDSVDLDTHESVNMLNLVEGEAIAVVSIDGSFEPLRINYAETFIVPAAVMRYRIKNMSTSKDPVAVLQAFVRNP